MKRLVHDISLNNACSSTHFTVQWPHSSIILGLCSNLSMFKLIELTVVQIGHTFKNILNSSNCQQRVQSSPRDTNSQTDQQSFLSSVTARPAKQTKVYHDHCTTVEYQWRLYNVGEAISDVNNFSCHSLHLFTVKANRKTRRFSNRSKLTPHQRKSVV